MMTFTMPPESSTAKNPKFFAIDGVEGITLPTIVGLTEVVRDHAEDSSKVRLVAQPGAVSLDRVAQQYARAVTGIGTDQLWAALRQWGAATLTGREGR